MSLPLPVKPSYKTLKYRAWTRDLEEDEAEDYCPTAQMYWNFSDAKNMKILAVSMEQV